MKKMLVIVFVCLTSAIAFGQKSVSPTKTIKDQLNEEYCTGLFKSSEGVIVDLLMDEANVTSSQSYFNILDWLNSRVAGLQIATLRSGVRVPVIRGQLASIYVDETPVGPGYLNALPVSDIAMIKVIKSSFPGSAYGSGGALAIYTIRAEEEQ